MGLGICRVGFGTSWRLSVYVNALELPINFLQNRKCGGERFVEP